MWPPEKLSHGNRHKTGPWWVFSQEMWTQMTLMNSTAAQERISKCDLSSWSVHLCLLLTCSVLADSCCVPAVVTCCPVQSTGRAMSLRTDGERSTRQSCGWSTVDTESQDLRQPSMFKQCSVGACTAETIYSRFLFNFKGEFIFM